MRERNLGGMRIRMEEGERETGGRGRLGLEKSFLRLKRQVNEKENELNEKESEL
jgi:hypothetical protein